MLELKPMLSALWRNKISALLIALQLALTLAIISNTTIIIKERVEKIFRPTGIAVEDIITTNFQVIPQEYDVAGAVTADLDLLRSLPGVIDASVTNQIPLSGSGSSATFFTEPEQEIGGNSINFYHTDSHFINTLGMKLIAGRNFTEAEVVAIEPNNSEYRPKVSIITKQIAEKLFPNENAVGKFIYPGSKGSPIEIVGIVERHLGSWVSRSNAGDVIFFPLVVETRNKSYLIHTETGKRDEVLKQVENKLSERDPRRVIETNHLSQHLARSYVGDNIMVKTLSIVSAMLTFIVALGIVGLTIFWINQRAKQIGVRRALGASRANIIRYFLLENSLIAGTGIAIGSATALIANQYIVRDYSQPTLTLIPLVICASMVLLVSFTAALVPAMRAANISPATATRSV